MKSLDKNKKEGSITGYLYNLPDRLRRVTSGGKLIREIDGLRFLAIFPVIVQHLNERIVRYADPEFIYASGSKTMSAYMNRGFVGVYIFFVISGFILALPFASHYLKNTRKIELKDYFWRRVTRLEPPYIIAMSIIFLILYFFIDGYGNEIIPRFFSGIFYVHNIIYQDHNPVNPPTWTLEIEIQFYLLAPLLSFFVFNIKKTSIRRSVIFIAILSLLVIQNLSGIMHTWLTLTILAQLQYFLIGFLIADIYLLSWNDKTTNHYYYDLIAILAFPALLMVWSWDHHLTNRIIFCGLLFILFISVFRGIVVNRFFSNKWIMSIGGMCYTIYLIHLPIAELFVKITQPYLSTTYYPLNFLIQLVLFLPVLFVFCVIFYLAIEKPCMDKDWPKKFGNAIGRIFHKKKDHKVVKPYETPIKA